jgi:hypothetical protein
MNQVDVETWLSHGYHATRPATCSAGFWPAEKSQGQWTEWANAFFIHGTNHLCGGTSLQIRLSPRVAMSPTLRGLTTFPLVQRQSIVDYSVINVGASEPIQLTAESECDTQQPVDDGCGENSYGWDFYKLLVVPSPRRLFFCCIGGGGRDDTLGLSASDRRQKAISSLRSLYEQHSSAFVRATDEIAGVIIAPSKKERRDSWFFGAARGVFRVAQISKSAVIGP